jgi:hypothetical protein
MNDPKMIDICFGLMKKFKDGDSWCFVLPDFIDLQNSPSYWPEKDEKIDLNKIYLFLKKART